MRQLLLLLLPIHRGAAYLTSTVCQDLWPDRSSVIGADSLCYAAIDSQQVDDTMHLTERTCTVMINEPNLCSAALCKTLPALLIVNCSFGGQRRGYELPGGWEIASAFTPQDAARGSVEAITDLAKAHTFGSTGLQMRDASVMTIGWPMVFGNKIPNWNALVGVVLGDTPGTTSVHWFPDADSPDGKNGGWQPVNTAKHGVTSKTSDKILIRTCPPGTFMWKYSETAAGDPRSACSVCNATTGCQVEGILPKGWECHTTRIMPSSGALEMWDGAGSTDCVQFQITGKTPYENECQAIFSGQEKNTTRAFTHASYSPVDRNCYRTLEEAIPPSLATPIGRQSVPIKIIPAGFEIVDLRTTDAATNVTRRAAQQIAWTYPFATRTLVMRGALLYVRDGIPGVQAGGTFRTSTEVCPSGGVKYCDDLVTVTNPTGYKTDGWCPSSWCNAEIAGQSSTETSIPARILLKTCEKGYYSQTQNVPRGLCTKCSGQTLLNGVEWDKIGSNGCAPGPTTAPTAAPTGAPTSTPPQCSHVVEGGFGRSCIQMCGTGDASDITDGATLCDVAATAILATSLQTGEALLRNRTSFFTKHLSTGCVNTLKADITVLPFPSPSLSPTYNRELLLYASAPFITVDGLPPVNDKCGTFELSVREAISGPRPFSPDALAVLTSACKLAGDGSTRRLCCCTTVTPPSSAGPASNAPLPVYEVVLIAAVLLCATLTLCVVAIAAAAYIWVAARRRRNRRLDKSDLNVRSMFGAFGHKRLRSAGQSEMTPRLSAMSDISRALLQPEARSASDSSAGSIASDDARARRIVEQGLWIDPETIVVGRKLAAGGMGELRLGRMTLPGGRSKVTVVLKSSFIEMLGGDADEFWHEASMLSQIKHPQVVRLFGVTQKEVRGMLKAETQNRLFLVMEYCANGSLTDAVKRPEGYNRKRDFLRHVEQITSTLAWLHEQGIVHRDIKPSNVLLDDEGNAKLCDLGLSRFQPGIGPGASPSVGFTSATMTVGAGSAPYMPPEGLADTEPGPQGGEEVRQRHYDGRAWDIYSLAILLTQMWTRKELYKGLGVFQIVVRVSQGMRPKLSTDPREVPPRLREIVSKMWDADRHARPSAEEVLAMLREDGVLAAQIEDVSR